MTDRNENVLRESSSQPPTELDWEQEKTKVRVRQFMNILEQLPRLCSPTICGTLSQPTTRNEKTTRGADMFEWSLEQKAILSPANITTDTDGTDDWQNVADLNPSWRQQESDMFFSQRTIAPSPLVTPPLRVLNRPQTVSNEFQDLLCSDEDDGQKRGDKDDDDNYEAQDLSIGNKDQSAKTMSYELEDDDQHFLSDHSDDEHDDDTYNDDGNNHNDSKQEDQDEMMDNLFFSPQPLKSSQTQQRMDIFSPDTFVRVMEDESTLQSTPKTTGSLQRTRTRARADVLD